MKKCSKCKRELPDDMFNKRPDRKSGLKSSCKDCCRVYSEANKERTKIRNRERFLQNREAILERERERYSKNKEQHAIWMKEWYIKNKERSRANSKRWENENPDKRALIKLRRKLAEKQAIPNWLSEEDEIRIREIYKACRQMTKDLGIDHHVDHIVPLRGENVCGLHVPWNLQILTAEENLAKQNKFTSESEDASST